MALAHAILAAILDAPTTGYALAKQFGADGYFWRATHQQIYSELSKLEESAMIEPAMATPGARRNRPVAITDAGRAHLVEWVREPTAPAAIKEDLLVKCLSLRLVTRTELAEQIAVRQRHHQDRLDRYQIIATTKYASADQLNDAQLGHYLTLTAGISYEQQWISWADTAITLLTVRNESRPRDGSISTVRRR